MEETKSILITGASTGIGRACALHMAAAGFTVFAGVRKTGDGEALQQASSGRLIPVLLDVTEAASIDEAVKTVSDATGGALFGLMNNAGISASGALELLTIPAIRQVFDVNVLGMFAVTKAFLPLLRKSQGRIINTASISGLFAAPGMSVYAASKHAVEGLSESLRLELRPFGISVSVLEPGAIRAEIWSKALAQGQTNKAHTDPDIYQLYAPLVKFYKNLIDTQPYLPPETVADCVHHAFTAKKPKNHYLIGKDARQMAFARCLPEKLRDWIVFKTIYKD